MDDINLIEFNNLYEFGPFRLNAPERVLFRGDDAVPLTGKALNLLLILVASAGHLKTREELTLALWPRNIVEEHSLTSYISTLRKALGDEGDVPRYIETVRGHGYRFIATVVEPASEPSAENPPEPDANESPRTDKSRWRIAIPVLAVGVAVVVAVFALDWYFTVHKTAKTAVPTPVVAVLPFENLSTDKSNAYFAAGIQDTILSKLAGIGELRVISRISTMRYASHPVDLKKVAANLGATAVMEGSVQKAGDKVLINVQLIDARTNEHIWAQVYTRSLADVFVVENDVATQVATALKAKLLPKEVARLALVPTHDPQAYLLFLKANYYANQVTGSNSAKNFADTINQASDLYRQAIARDPQFALAWARLSYLKSFTYWRQDTRKTSDAAEAEHAAKQALALAPDLPQAHLAMGYVDYYGYYRLTAALAQFEQARRSLRNNVDVIAAIALVYRRQGKLSDALSGFQQAHELDPLNARWSYETGVTLMMHREYALAGRQFNLALALAPDNYDDATMRVTALILASKPLRQIRKALTELPYSNRGNGMLEALQFRVAWLARRPDEALASVANAPDWVSSYTAVGLEPAALLQARAWALKGDAAQAQAAYKKARDILKNALRHQPKEASLWSFLGLAEAGLAHKPEALQAGIKATRLTPVSEDAVYGPPYLFNLAKIYAQVGEPRQAVELLRQLLAMPAGIYVAVPLLELDPIWDPIRQDSQFQDLLKEHNHGKVPVPTVDRPAT